MSGNFALDMDRFTARVTDRLNSVIKKVFFDMSREIVENSPVGNPSLWAANTYVPPGYVGGHFRANWQYGLDDYPTVELDTIDDGTESNMARIIMSVNPEAIGHVHYLVNNTPYSLRLENGSSTQAPNGIVGRAVLKFEEFIIRNSI